MPTISLYLKDEILDKLDAEVSRRAAADVSRGLSGRAITTRSSYIESVLQESLDSRESLSLETIKHFVIELAEEYGAKKVSLFGSFARGDATEESDIDLLLDKGDIKGMQVLEFQDELSKRIGRKVDVVTTAGASKRFLNKISEDEVVLYAAS